MSKAESTYDRKIIIRVHIKGQQKLHLNETNNTEERRRCSLNNYARQPGILRIMGPTKPRKMKNMTHVIMLEETQHLKLPVSPLRRRKTLKNVGHLLQSDPLSISRICHRPVHCT